MPLNPLKINFLPLLNRTIGTYFNQNWKLFAPDPVTQNYTLLVQPRLNKKESIDSTMWYNVSDPFWDKFHKNRFTAYDRLARSQTNAIRRVLSGGNNLVLIFRACNKGDSIACKIYDESLILARQKAEVQLISIASAFVKDLAIKNNYNFIALRVRITSYSPWSKRNERKPSFIDIDLGVFLLNNNVEASGVFL